MGCAGSSIMRIYGMGEAEENRCSCQSSHGSEDPGSLMPWAHVKKGECFHFHSLDDSHPWPFKAAFHIANPSDGSPGTFSLLTCEDDVPRAEGEAPWKYLSAVLPKEEIELGHSKEPVHNAWVLPRMHDEDTCFRLRPAGHRLTTVHLTSSLAKLAMGDGACLELRRPLMFEKQA